MITKKITTEHGDVESFTEIIHTDNGQVLLHVVSKLGDLTHEHQVTVGAADGKDTVAEMSADDLKALLQKHLDETRANAAKILAGRALTGKVASQLE